MTCPYTRNACSGCALLKRDCIDQTLDKTDPPVSIGQRPAICGGVCGDINPHTRADCAYDPEV